MLRRRADGSPALSQRRQTWFIPAPPTSEGRLPVRDWPVRIRKSEHATPQTQIREALISAILDGRLARREPVPSTRRMAGMLKVPRSTVVVAYQSLLDDGYLIARERSGYYVSEKAFGTSPQYRLPLPRQKLPAAKHASDHSALWESRLMMRPARTDRIVVDWTSCRYPFVGGQVDQKLFPIAEWRDCAHLALSKRSLAASTGGSCGADDPLLVEHLRRRILPRRGIIASENQILVTQGARGALYLLVRLLVGERTRTVMEEPGYPDLRTLLGSSGGAVATVPVDDDGLDPARLPAHADLLFTTPSLQFPTTATMPLERRRALLAAAAERDFVVIENGCEFATGPSGEPCPALKSLDAEGRVVYVESLSNTLLPGLHLGFLVGPERLVEEARALRRLMLGTPATHTARTAALFLALGHHEGLLRKLERIYRRRREAANVALSRHLPGAAVLLSPGSAGAWARGPEGLDSDRLALTAAERGVALQSGRPYFAAAPQPCNFFRLGFSLIDESRIEPGIRLIADIIGEISTEAS